MLLLYKKKQNAILVSLNDDKDEFNVRLNLQGVAKTQMKTEQLIKRRHGWYELNVDISKLLNFTNEFENIRIIANIKQVNGISTIEIPSPMGVNIKQKLIDARQARISITIPKKTK